MVNTSKLHMCESETEQLEISEVKLLLSLKKFYKSTATLHPRKQRGRCNSSLKMLLAASID
jgi:hypothetical protein